MLSVGKWKLSLTHRKFYFIWLGRIYSMLTVYQNWCVNASLQIMKDKSRNHFPFFLSFVFLRITPGAYGGSQVRSLIRAVAAGLCHSHSNTGSLTHWVKLGIEPESSWILVGFITTEPWQELHLLFLCFSFYSHTCGIWMFLGPGLNQSCHCSLHHSSRQHRIINPLIEARDGTSVLMDASQIR